MFTRVGWTSAEISRQQSSLFFFPRYHLLQVFLLLGLFLSPRTPFVCAGVAKSSVKRQLSNHGLDVILIPSASGLGLRGVATDAEDVHQSEAVPPKGGGGGIEATSLRQRERTLPGGANINRAQFVPDVIAGNAPAATPPVGQEQQSSPSGLEDESGLPQDPAELMAVLALLQSLGMADETIGGFNGAGLGGFQPDAFPEGAGGGSSVPEHLQFTTLEPHLGPAILPLQVPKGYFVPFLPRRAFGVENGVSRPAHGHASFYEHRPPGLVDVRNTPAYGFIFGGYRRFKSE
ncbi:uncharacterized protein LOC143034066 [Oratosquilla oratoria]|uniref:uncharacterized protein LOC143034066 n=1 Tax=Oratosquilla oratoria TaxID=337810 RepID=UPI003F75CDBB